MNNIELAVRAYQRGGLSIIPINRRTKRAAGWLLPQKTTDDGRPLYWQALPSGAWAETTEDTGRKCGTWKPYQTRFPTQDEIDHWLRARIQALAVVCGKASGGVEILDFDTGPNGETWYDAWCAQCCDVADRYNLPVQQTGGGGFQTAWRCEEVEGNQGLAWALTPGKNPGHEIMIETRGEGGYALLPPSMHPSGNRYNLLLGKFSQIPTITPDHRRLFLECARTLNQVEVNERKSSGGNTQYTSSGSNEVGEAYNKAHPIEEMLRKYGYTDHGSRWSRPDKPDSMGLVVFNDGKAYAFSSNDVMSADRCAVGKNQPFSSFDLFAYYGHGEDYSAATKAAAIELGLHTELHTLIYVEGYTNAAVTRDLMFNHGWVVRGFTSDKISLDDTGKYSNVIVWSYKDTLSQRVAGMIPGAYPLVVPRGLDAPAMAKDGILQPYLQAALADANNTAEVGTWTL
jgi:hypothetical protein